MKKVFLILPLFISLSHHAFEFVPQACVDMYNLSGHIVGPLDVKKQGNNFIKGLVYGATNTFRERYFHFDGIKKSNQNLICVNFLYMAPSALSFIDVYQNRNSLCLIARILGYSAGQIVICKIPK